MTTDAPNAAPDPGTAGRLYGVGGLADLTGGKA